MDFGDDCTVRSLADHWCLNRDIDFLNHGSFGACPTAVLADQRHWVDCLERDPIEFLAPERGLLPRLQRVRQAIAELVGANPADLVFVRNATDGVNAVLRSFPLQPGDQVLITNHGYGACNRAVRWTAERCGASVVCAEVPFPIQTPEQVVAAVAQAITPRTRLAVIDHVTSPTAVIFPIEQITQWCHRHGVRVLVDGAHAAGMLPIDLQRIGADYYTGNHHKWLCGPKASGFLHVQPPWQDEVRPTVISHAPTGHSSPTRERGTGHLTTDSSDEPPSQFQAEFSWVGTYDPSPLLAMPCALEFLQRLMPGGLNALIQHNHALACRAREVILAVTGLPEAAPESMLGSMATVILDRPRGGDLPLVAQAIRHRLLVEHRIEVPVFPFGSDRLCLRVSAQAYNHLQQYQRLAEALSTRC